MSEDQAWPLGPEDDPDKVVERYGPGPTDVVLWDTTSNYAHIRAMRLAGKTIPEIASALNLKPSVVKGSLTNQLKAECAAIDPDEMITILGMEMERLDHMLQGYWFAAKAGDLDAAKYILQISRERREWLKWAKPEPTADLGMTANVLVIGGSEAEFLKGLETARGYLEEKYADTVEAETVENEDD